MGDYLGYENAFKRAGISYTKENDYAQRGHGDIPKEKIKFIVLHHTAGSNNDGPNINVVRDGRSDLPGPLSQLCLKRNGQPHIIAAGVSWHAFGEVAFRGVPAGSGNYWSIGIEAIDSGYNTWTNEQRDSYPRVVAALLVDLGLDDKAWIFHRDFQPRSKIDPAGFEAGWFQTRVTQHYNQIKGIANTPTKTAIELVADALKLGKPTTDERTCPDGIGKNRVYENHIVYWTPQTPAAAIGGDNLKKYAQLGYEKSVLGYPITNETKIRDNGTYQRFQKGNMYYTQKYGSKIVFGAIFNKWGELKYENGPLGYPVTDELETEDKKGRYNEFEFGTVYWSAKTGAHEVHGLIRDAWKSAGGLKTLGFPLTDERETPNKSGLYNHFENGSVYFKKGQKKAVVVPKWVVDAWSQLGWEQGTLGFPVGDVVKIDGVEQQAFEGGSIAYDTASNKTLIGINGKWAPVIKKETVASEAPKAPVTTVTPKLPVNSKIIDYSANVPKASDVKARGYKGVIRYISPARDAWMKGKPMSKAEFDDMRNNGLQVAFVFQNLKNDWLNGYVGGVADAKMAQAHLNMLGVPNAVVYCAIDSNLNDNRAKALEIWNSTAAEYVKGFQSVMGKNRTGVYANSWGIEWASEDGLGTYYWQHDWGSDGVTKLAHLHQLPFKNDKVGSLDVDENIVLKEYFGQV